MFIAVGVSFSPPFLCFCQGHRPNRERLIKPFADVPPQRRARKRKPAFTPYLRCYRSILCATFGKDTLLYLMLKDDVGHRQAGGVVGTISDTMSEQQRKSDEVK